MTHLSYGTPPILYKAFLLDHHSTYSNLIAYLVQYSFVEFSYDMKMKV